MLERSHSSVVRASSHFHVQRLSLILLFSLLTATPTTVLYLCLELSNPPRLKYILRNNSVFPERTRAIPRYSAHNCVGNEHARIDDSTRCHFRNVCVELNDSIGDIDTPVVPFWTPRPSSVRMFYYRPPVAFGKPLYWSGSTNLVCSQSTLDTGC